MKKSLLLLVSAAVLCGCQTVSVNETPNLYSITEAMAEKAAQCVRKSPKGYVVSGDATINNMREVEVASNNPYWFKSKFEQNMTTGGYVFGFVMLNIKTKQTACGSYPDNLKLEPKHKISGWRKASEADASLALNSDSDNTVNPIKNYTFNTSINSTIYKNDTSTIELDTENKQVKISSANPYFARLREIYSASRDPLLFDVFASNKKFKPVRGTFDRKRVNEVAVKGTDINPSLIISDVDFFNRFQAASAEKQNYIYLSGMHISGSPKFWLRVTKN
jgi:hypothetical protein